MLKPIASVVLAYLLGTHCLAVEEAPHVVLVMADDHGFGDTGYNGHPFVRTPHLDAMAEGGVVFERFYASAPVCSPTRASFMTGRHPFRTNVPNHGHYMRPQEVTLAEVAKSAGYVTGHFGKWHIGSVQAESPTSPGGAGFDEWLSGLNFFDNNPYLSRQGRYEQLIGAGTVLTTDATIEFLRKHAGLGRPIFSVTWFPAPHSPHEEVPQGSSDASEMYAEQSKQAGYYREITLLDQQVGRLRQCLRDLNIEGQTLFLYCSDNGGLVDASAGGRDKKGSIYEGGLRVPALVEWPGRYAPQRVHTPVFTSDLYPTLVSIMGGQVEHQPQLDGRDLEPLFSGAAFERTPMGFWHGFRAGQATWSDRIIKSLHEAQQAGEPSPFPERIFKNVREFPEVADMPLVGHAAWNDWPWKLHRIEQDGTVTLELYHLEEDPGEQRDVHREHPQRVASMLTALEDWQRSVLASWAGDDYVDLP